jgi:hypothetical protein
MKSTVDLPYSFALRSREFSDMLRRGHVLEKITSPYVLLIKIVLLVKSCTVCIYIYIYIYKTVLLMWCSLRSLLHYFSSDWIHKRGRNFN